MKQDGFRILSKISRVYSSIFGRSNYRIFALTVSAAMVACVQSPAPEVEEIVKVNAPTFNLLTDAFISSPTQVYTLNGECDANASVTEYSLDESSWSEVPCTNGRFSVSLTLLGFQDVWARSKGKFNYTSNSKARVRFLLPPTSDSILAGTSTKSDKSDAVGAGSQNFISPTFEGNSPQSASLKIDSYLPRIVYEE